MTEAELNAALEQLRQRKVVAAATETFYGLLADATDARALDTLFAIKPREEGKAVGLLLPDRHRWTTLVAQVSPLAQALAAAFWPGPLTLVLPAAANLDSRLVSGEGVGVRLGGPSDAARIAERYGRPLTATSANPPGQPATGLASVVSAAFAEAISRGQLLVIAGESPAGSASTVVTVSAGEARVLRLGAVSAEDIQRVARTSSSGPEQP